MEENKGETRPREDLAAEAGAEGRQDQGLIRTAFNFAVMVAVICLGVFLLAHMTDDLRFFFSSRIAADLGRAEKTQPQALANNSFVRMQGITSDRAARAEVGMGLFRAQMLYFHLLGSKVFIQVKAPIKGGEPPVTPYTDVTVEGRLVRFDREGGQKTIANYFDETYGFDFDTEKYFLVEVGESPGRKLRYPAGAGVISLVVLFNIFMFGRAVAAGLKRKGK